MTIPTHARWMSGENGSSAADRLRGRTVDPFAPTLHDLLRLERMELGEPTTEFILAAPQRRPFRPFMRCEGVQLIEHLAEFA